MKKSSKLLITLIIGLILIVAFYLITNAITRYTGFSVSPVLDKEKEFLDCLKEEDITLYINSDNALETLRGIKVVDYLSSIKIINCLRFNQVCLENNVNSFPTWVINGKLTAGDISLSDLSKLSGCNLSN